MNKRTKAKRTTVREAAEGEAGPLAETVAEPERQRRKKKLKLQTCSMSASLLLFLLL